MPEIWISLTGLIILFLFWRQLAVFKIQGKINYAPLVLIIGSISSLSLFIFSSGELKSDIQYSLMPLLMSLIFYMLMYIMYQFKVNDVRVQHNAQEQLLSTLMADIHGYFGVLDEKLSAISSTEEKTLQAIQLTLKNELSSFSELSARQELISKKLEDMYNQEEGALMNIQTFLEQDVMNLDKVVHRHIDILRISEQDHFNKLQNILNNMNGMEGVEDALVVLTNGVHKMEKGFEKRALSLASEMTSIFKANLQSMSVDLQNAKQLSESLGLSTQEYEMKLEELHKQASLLLQKSDIIHESMEDTYTQAQKVRPVYDSLNELISRLIDIYGDYKLAKKELHQFATTLGSSEDKHFEVMDKKIDTLSQEITEKIEASLTELKEHYHIADRDVTSTVKTLAAKAQLQKSYAEE
jgi:hypothetical protein